MSNLAPWLVNLQKQLVRAPVNPLDKSTIVSIFPKEVNEKSITLTPGYFRIPAGSYTNPSLLVVGPSSWWKEMPENQQHLEIVNHSIQIADSIVKDYCNGLLGCDMGTRMPGLFYVVGEKNLDQIRKEHKADLDAALIKQRNWFAELVKIADIMWSRTNGNPLGIGDNERMAARELNLENKDWLLDSHTIEKMRCVACGNLNSANVIVCPNCKVVIDRKRFEEMRLTFAS